jgi:hypothetical protein
MQYAGSILFNRLNYYAVSTPLTYLSGTASNVTSLLARNTFSPCRTSRTRRHPSWRRASHSSVKRSCYSTPRVQQPSSVGLRRGVERRVWSRYAVSMTFTTRFGLHAQVSHLTKSGICMLNQPLILGPCYCCPYARGSGIRYCFNDTARLEVKTEDSDV